MNKVIKYTAIGFGSLVGITALLTALKVVTLPTSLISKTADTTNVIHNYEWFHDVDAAIQAKKGQLSTHVSLLKDADAGERSRLNMEVAAIRQSCRDLVTKYNANSEKINRGIFKGTSLPELHNVNVCDR